MIKVTVERDGVTQVFWIGSVENISELNTKLVKDFYKEQTEMHEKITSSYERIESRVKGLGYDNLSEALDALNDMKEERESLLQIQEEYDDIERTATSLGYNDIQSAFDAIEKMQSAFSDISDIVNGYT